MNSDQQPAIADAIPGREATCPTCGTPLRRGVATGLCPRCLMGRALSPPPGDPGGAAAQPEGLPRKRVGPFELESEIGRGGMGIVFLAREVALGRRVAVKLLHGGEWASSELRERFQIEAQAAAALQHPHIVPVYAFGEEDGIRYIAMQWIPGGSLAGWARRTVPADSSPSRAAALIVRKLATAVHYAHQRGVLHRDLKPENVLLDAASEPFLTDFGLARWTTTDQRLTRSLSALGTPAYLAPEVARQGSGQSTVLSDVYGLGAILYELLTGEPPFSGPSPMETLRRAGEGNLRRPSAVVPGIPRDLETVCLQALALEPAARYRSAEALGDDLQRWLDGRPVRARPAGPVERTVKWTRRHPLIASLLAVLGILLLIIGVGSWRIAAARSAEAERRRLSLVHLQVETASRLAEERNAVGSLASQVRALQLDSRDPAEERLHRIRIGLTLQDLPRVVRLWRHDAAANGVQFSPNEEQVLSAGADGTARIWNVADGTAGRVFRHPAAVTHARFSPNGRQVLTVCCAGGARLWDVASGRALFDPWPIHCADYKLPLAPPAAFSPNGSRILVVSSERFEVRDTATGERVAPPVPLPGRGVHGAFSPDGARVVTTESSGRIQVWSLAEDHWVAEGSLTHPREALFAEFLGSGDHVVSVMLGAQAVVWEASSGQVRTPPLHHDNPMRIGQIAVAPQGGRVLTLSFDNSVRVWDGGSGQLLSHGIRHRVGISVARWDTTGSRILTGSFDGMAKLWDAGSGRVVESWLPHGSYVVDVGGSRDDRRIVTAAHDGHIRLWELSPGAATRSWIHHQEGAPLAVDGTGSSMVTLGADGTLWRTDCSREDLPRRHLGSGQTIRRMSLDHSGQRLASISPQGRVELLEVSSGRRTQAPELVPGAVHGLLMDARGGQIAVWSADPGGPLFTLFDAEPLRVRARGRVPGPSIELLRFSPDGRRFLTRTLRGSIRLWAAATGASIGEEFLPGVESSVADFSPDSGLMVAGRTPEGFDPGESRLWSLAKGEWVGRPMEHEDGVIAVEFSADGTLLATGGQDSTARLWHVPSGTPRVQPLPHDNPVKTLRFAGDGRILATATRAGAVRLWDSKTGSPLMPPQQVPGGLAEMFFVRGGSPLVALGNRGDIMRWEFEPAPDRVDQLQRLAEGLERGLPPSPDSH